MKKDNLIYFVFFLLIVIIVYIISYIIENERIQSYAFYGLSAPIGLIIGYFIRNKIRIISKKKLRIELFVFLSLAFVISILISQFINNIDVKIISVLLLNLLMLVILIYRNVDRSCIKS